MSLAFRLQPPMNPVSCQYCSKQFQTRQMLRQHFLYRHSSAGIKCQECYFIARSQKDLDSHRCKVKQVLDCDQCAEKFRSKRDLMIHRKMHNIKHYCMHCEKSFADLSRLNKHIQDSHVDAGFECSTCNRKFYCKESFTFHVKYAHTEQKIVQCNLCLRSFKSMKYLKVHINAFHKKKQANVAKVNLDSKGKDPRYQAQLLTARKMLAKRNHSTTSKMDSYVAPFQSRFRAMCPDCHKIVNSPTTLYAHKVLHKNPKVCSKCKAEFAWTWHMKKHERICNGVPSTRMLNKKIKPYQCFLCNTRFTNGSELTDHMRDHAKHDFGLGTSAAKMGDNLDDEDEDEEMEDGNNGISSGEASPMTHSEVRPLVEQTQYKADATVVSANHCSMSTAKLAHNQTTPSINTIQSRATTDGSSASMHSWIDMRSRMETPIDFEERIGNVASVGNNCRTLVDANNRSMPSVVTVVNQNQPPAPTIAFQPGPTTSAVKIGGHRSTNPAKYVLEKSCFARYEYAAASTKESKISSTQCSINGINGMNGHAGELGIGAQHFSGLEDNLDSVQGILNEVFDNGGPLSPISDSCCLNTPYANSLLLLDDSFVIPHDML